MATAFSPTVDPLPGMAVVLDIHLDQIALLFAENSYWIHSFEAKTASQRPLIWVRFRQQFK